MHAKSGRPQEVVQERFNFGMFQHDSINAFYNVTKLFVVIIYRQKLKITSFNIIVQLT
jgi:hypothetical protein